MICSKCGFDVPDNMHFCGVCGAEVTAQYQENQQADFINQQPAPEFNAPMYNQNYGQSFQQPVSDPDDKPDSLVNAMSFFYPIFGFILYFVDKEKRPVQAKAALKWAIISAVCYVIFFALYFAAIFGFTFFVNMAGMGMMI